MMLADPRGMQADLLGVNRLVEDIGDELVGLSPVVVVVIVAQREIAEFHLLLPVDCRVAPDWPPSQRQCRRYRKAEGATKLFHGV
jgi:hypothetical protein